jgi:hypothetical protein
MLGCVLSIEKYGICKSGTVLFNVSYHRPNKGHSKIINLHYSCQYILWACLL